MERVAIGFLEMTAAEFEGYTARELQWRYDAVVERENREFRRIAQLACWVINPWLGQHAKPIQVRDLLGTKKTVAWWDEE